MTVTIEVITESDIKKFAEGELSGSERDRIGDFIDRDDEANAVYHRATARHVDAQGPSRRVIGQAFSLKQRQVDGTSRRMAIAAAAILGVALMVAGVAQSGVFA